jgi:hypothetical protein
MGNDDLLEDIPLLSWSSVCNVELYPKHSPSAQMKGAVTAALILLSLGVCATLWGGMLRYEMSR